VTRYVLTELAASDLQDIADFISQNSPETAVRVLKELRDAVERLAEMPHLGHTREDLADTSIRFWTVYSSFIVYRPAERPLEVLRVLSVYRDVRRLLP
jgi:plasmid stabilization system protein ParE